MKITVLNDDVEGPCCAEHGFSLLLEEDKKILFDLGPSDIFLKNAKLLGETVEDIDCIVLSHGHWDHGNGLQYLKNKPLICHPSCFLSRWRKRDGTSIGLPLSLAEAEQRYNLILSRDPYWIADNVVFLGEVPRLNNFESKTTDFYTERHEDDFVEDDSGLVVNTPQGLMVFAGCSHAGICNIIDYAKIIFDRTEINVVLGGLHLKTVDDITHQTIQYLKEQNIKNLFVSHCTSAEVYSVMKNEPQAARTSSGLVLNF